MVGNHWEQLVLGLGYHFLSFQPQKRLKNRISRFEFSARRQQKWSKTPFLGYLVPPKGYRGVLHRCMGKVKKFEPSSTLILRRNSHWKKVWAESAPPCTIRDKSNKYNLFFQTNANSLTKPNLQQIIVKHSICDPRGLP